MDEGNKMYQVSCDDVACGFTIKGRDKDELVMVLKMHAKNIHNLDATDEEIQAKIKEV